MQLQGIWSYVTPFLFAQGLKRRRNGQDETEDVQECDADEHITSRELREVKSRDSNTPWEAFKAWEGM